jgi:hypothetical protein
MAVEPAAQLETGDEADEEAGHHPAVNAIWSKYNGHLTFRALFEAYDAGRVAGERDELQHWLRKAKARDAQYVTVEELQDARRVSGR